MDVEEINQALTNLADVFDLFGIAYYIGGSVASSIYGKRRNTRDVDIVAHIELKQVQMLVNLLKDEYYIDADMIRDALRHQSSFNLLHHRTGIKIDIFILKNDTFSQQEMARARKEELEPETRPFYLASPEDVILSKLLWRKMGGHS